MKNEFFFLYSRKLKKSYKLNEMRLTLVCETANTFRHGVRRQIERRDWWSRRPTNGARKKIVFHTRELKYKFFFFTNIVESL